MISEWLNIPAEEIKNMCDELFEINKDFLGDYK